MEWIKTILPLIGVIIGWLLSESGKIFADKRQDKRRLQKLLFFLLELRYHFSKELSIEIDLDYYISTLKHKMVNKLGLEIGIPELSIGLDTWKPIIEQTIRRTNSKENSIDFLIENIDKILIELAEVFPILAYELSGRHNIKDRLKRLDNYFDEINSLTNELPFDIKKWINPKLTKELLDDIDKSIAYVASKIGNKTYKMSIEKIEDMSVESNNTEIELLIDEYLDKVKISITK